MSKPSPIAQMDDAEVICPYCLASYQPEACEYSDAEREEECEKCGKTYLLFDDCSVTHFTRAKEETK